MKRWWLVIALLLSLGVNVGIVATRAWQSRPADDPAATAPPPGGEPTGERPAGEQPQSRDPRMPPFIYRMAEELGLAGEERETFVDRQRRFFEETLWAREELAHLQGELRREITAEEPDREKIDRLLEESGRAHETLERAFVDNLLDTRELLGPEQERRYLRFLVHLRGRRGEELRDELRQRFPLRGRRPWGAPHDRPGFAPGPGHPPRRPGWDRRRPPAPPEEPPLPPPS